MRWIIALIMLFALASVASVAAEKVTLGPYSVSFNLNNSDQYKVKVNDPVSGKNAQLEPKRWNQANVYSFNIVGNDNSRGIVSITQWANSTDATFTQEISTLRLEYTCLGFKNITVAFPRIDGQNAAFVAAYGNPSPNLGNKAFTAWYWLDKVDLPDAIVSYGKERVRITGNLSAESTKNLLDTIHVAKP
jgi:hypothetical protein